VNLFLSGLKKKAFIQENTPFNFFCTDFFVSLHPTITRLMKKYITTTLPYLNSTPHIGHTFEFVIADVIAEFHRHRYGKYNTFFNVGVDEHGQKIYDKAIAEGYTDIQVYCDEYAVKWKDFCSILKIDYDNFYRTSDPKHKEFVKRFYDEIKEHIYEKEYVGDYCVGCEAYILPKDQIDGCCPIHKNKLEVVRETNKFFRLSSFKDIEDILVDKTRSNELSNLIAEDYDLSITRKNVKWGVETGDGDVYYVWAEALANYIFAIKYYEDKDFFDGFWNNSLIICGKDNLKFQAYILQALLKANNIPQTTGVLVHGTILDKTGSKMSKTQGNVIDPIEQINNNGVDALRYYLTFGVSLTKDSKFDEDQLKQVWNNDIVNGLGNLISRLLHLIDLKSVKLSYTDVKQSKISEIYQDILDIEGLYIDNNFSDLRVKLNNVVNSLNFRINDEKPWSSENYFSTLNEIYYHLYSIIPFYTIVLKEHKQSILNAFKENKKVILFNKL